MRKLASIRRIAEIHPIEGADLIVRVRVDDWYCVALKSEFNVGDLCVYFEIDSFIPLIPQVEHLRARAYKKMGDKEGIRIKTIKLKGSISQGLVLPVSSFFDMFVGSEFDEGQELAEYFLLGNDVSDLIGVEKYEPLVPAGMSGVVKGNFPSFIKKTDQDRCQNLGYKIFGGYKDTAYEVTMKLDGTSFTGFLNGVDTGVCSRNWQLQLDDSNAGNPYVRIFVDSGLQSALTRLGRNIAVQGELMGENIQGNKENITGYMLFVFDMYDIDNGVYLDPLTRISILRELYNNGVDKSKVQHVPILASNVSMSDMSIADVSGLLDYAKGPSLNAAVREGVVFKSSDGTFSFKAINNDWLLKHE